jgi:hypothetical protein
VWCDVKSSYHVKCECESGSENDKDIGEEGKRGENRD